MENAHIAAVSRRRMEDDFCSEHYGTALGTIFSLSGHTFVWIQGAPFGKIFAPCLVVSDVAVRY